MAVERVVVLRGMDSIAAVGHTLEESWKAILEGKSGIGPIIPKELGDRNFRIAAQVKDFTPEDYIKSDIQAFHRSHLFSVITSRRVFMNAVLSAAQANEIGILIGTGMGGGGSIADIRELILRDGDSEMLDPLAVQRLLGSRVSTAVSADLGTTGMADSHDSACATGNRTICLAYTMLSHPTAWRNLKAMLVGGAEASINPEGMAAFGRADMLSTKNKSPETACCPYDKEGAIGFVMGEGAAILPIALESFALVNKLPILAEVAGFGNSSDPKKNMFLPDVEGELMAMEEACEMAKIRARQIDYINGHGPGTPGDEIEREAILRLVGKESRVSISSTKAATGHMLGAAAAFEAQMCIMAINTGIIPPTLNLHNPMGNGELDFVALTPRQKRVDIAMNNSFGLNGINSVVIFRRYQERTSRTFGVKKAA